MHYFVFTKYRIPNSLKIPENKILQQQHLQREVSKKPILLKKVYFEYELLKYLQEWAT